MRWASAVSDSPEIEEAVAACADEVAAGLGGAAPDLTVVFVTAHHEDSFDRVPALLAARMRPGLLVGATAGGVIGGGCEVEDRPGLSVTAAVLPGVSLRSFAVEDDGLPDAGEAAEAWRAALGLADGEPPHLILLADPFTFDVEPFVRGLDAAFPGRSKVGGLASGARVPGGNRLYVDNRIRSSGAVGVALAGAVEVEVLVAQGCRPVGPPMEVTRVRGNVLFEVDGRPTAEAIQEIYDSLDDRDRALFRHSLFVGLSTGGAYLVRHIVGMDPESGALGLAAFPEEGRTVRFHLRDAEASADDLRAVLSRYAMETTHPPAGALLFSCLGRGVHLYGRPDHDTGLFRERLGDVPLGGFFCNGEIGPVGGSTYVHGYTSAFALFRQATA